MWYMSSLLSHDETRAMATAKGMHSSQRSREECGVIYRWQGVQPVVAQLPTRGGPDTPEGGYRTV